MHNDFDIVVCTIHRITESCHGIKFLPSLYSYLCIIIIFEGYKFLQCGKVTISAVQTLTQEKKIILHMRAVVEIGENFLPGKFSSCMVLCLYSVYANFAVL